MRASISEQLLLQGAWYALEQAGQLLDSAFILLRAKKFSTATGIAMLGREELGRYKLLRALAERVAQGETLSPKMVKDECDDHVTKQVAANLSATVRSSSDTGLGKLSFARTNEPPGSPARREIEEVLDSAFQAQRKRAPADRHRLRMRNLYVDLQPDGASWNRPLETLPNAARDAVIDARNDYSIQCDRLLNVPGDPKMLAIVKTMSPEPHLAQLLAGGDKTDV
jgi:AbiV family abortive infection protein